jgi:hypothetical protein
VRFCLAFLIELSCCAFRQRGSGLTQSRSIAGGQGRVAVSKHMRVRSTGQLGKRGLDPSCRGRESEDGKGLTKIVTTLISIGRLQRDQLPDAVGIPEQGVVVSVPGPATGE